MKHLSDHELTLALKKLISNERELLTKILGHLLEVDRRKLYAIFGYPSLFEYCITELGYSESSAYRRIQAMRLLRSLPQPEAKEIERRIDNGSLNLTQLAMAQDHLKKQQEAGISIRPEHKITLIHELQNKTTRECEKIIFAKAPANTPVVSEKIRRITLNHSELRLIVSDKLLAKLNRVRELKSHTQSNISYSELLEMLVDEFLPKNDPLLKAVSNQSASKHRVVTRTLLPTSEVKRVNSTHKANPMRFIPAYVKRLIYKRDGGKCTYQSEENGSICGSKHFIQIDHITPIALGGTGDPENLRLLCFAHNQSEAVKKIKKKVDVNELRPKPPS